MINNKLMIAAAGSGKTTFLVNEALKITTEEVLITTYTQANEAEITRKFLEINKCVPKNVTIQTWFSFLIQNCIKPFQNSFDKCLSDKDIKGLLLVNTPSAYWFTTKEGRKVYYGEKKYLVDHYFSKESKIYSDKLSKFAVGGGEKLRKTKERKEFVDLSIDRLSRLYDHIFIDEVQDLAGYDLEFLRQLFQSRINVLLVGDPRQVTYLTHNERKYDQYKYGKIKDFLLSECKKTFLESNIDETSLQFSHRNNLMICKFSSELYPQYSQAMPCDCIGCRENDARPHQGVFLVRRAFVNKYLTEFPSAMQLRDDRDVLVNEEYPVKNFGESKGLSFDRVLIYPTKPYIQWLNNNSFELPVISRSKLYVALTRARLSVGIVCDESITGINVFNPVN